MTHPLTEKIVEAVMKHSCRHCGGFGYTIEHDPEDPHEDGCSNCPIQVQCEDCHGEGSYVTLDSLRTAIQSVLDGERRPKLPEKIYVENVRAARGITFLEAKNVCEEQVRLGKWEKHTAVACRNCHRFITNDYESGLSYLLKPITCENCELMEEDDHIFTVHMKDIRTYYTDLSQLKEGGV